MTQTTVTEAQAAEVIVRTLTDLADQGVIELDGEQPLGPDTELFGEGGLLDSVGLVSLVVAVEEQLADELGLEVGLADERALSQRSSPYRTVGTLAAYATGSAGE